MRGLRNRIRKYFADPTNPVINDLDNKDLKYIDEYMEQESNKRKIVRVDITSDKLEVFREDSEGITIIRRK